MSVPKAPVSAVSGACVAYGGSIMIISTVSSNARRLAQLETDTGVFFWTQGFFLDTGIFFGHRDFK